MAWQPIDTAPRDGSPILVWDGCEISLVAWTSYSPGRRRRREHGWCVPGADGDWGPVEVLTPTHWHPLPGAPEE